MTARLLINPRPLLSASLMLVTLLGDPSAAPADPETLDRVKASIEDHTDGRVRVDTVKPTPIVGLYEVTTKGLDLFYADRSGRYGLVDGRLVDIREQRDLTAARLVQLRSIDFSKLPLSLAIKRGNGRRVLAVFEDPACPVCRSLHRFIGQLHDTTVYHFPFPVVTPGSVSIAAGAWCAGDRLAAWERAMQGAAVASGPSTECDISGLRQIVAAGDALHISGTPTVFLANGRRLQGAVPPGDFVAALDDASRSPTGASVARP
jgi:thiol:disulfide interchange protein DsbC